MYADHLTRIKKWLAAFHELSMAKKGKYRIPITGLIFSVQAKLLLYDIIKSVKEGKTVLTDKERENMTKFKASLTC